MASGAGPPAAAIGFGRGGEIVRRRRHDHGLRACAGEIDRDFAADAAAAAGDDHDFSLQTLLAFLGPSFFAIYGWLQRAKSAAAVAGLHRRQPHPTGHCNPRENL